MQVIQLNLQNLGFLDDLKAKLAKADAALHHTEATVKKDASIITADAKKDWQKASILLHVGGQECGTNQICQELATYGINASEKLEAKLVHTWMMNGKYGKWCSQNKVCMQAVQKALISGDAVEEKLVNQWLHPSSLQNLNWMDDIKAEAAKAKAALEKDATKAHAAFERAAVPSEGPRALRVAVVHPKPHASGGQEGDSSLL